MSGFDPIEYCTQLLGQGSEVIIAVPPLAVPVPDTEAGAWGFRADGSIIVRDVESHATDVDVRPVE
jgi:hypothetical protein